MIPALDTIHRRLLKTFCALELKISVSEMTNERLVNAIAQILSSTMNDQVPNVHNIMSQHLSMDLKQKDVKARILNYFDRFDELIEEYGLSIALDGNDKLKCRLLTDNLRPASLKEQVQLYQDLDPTVKINLPRLFDVIKAEALKNQQCFDLYHSSKDRTTTKPGAKMNSSTNKKTQSGDRSQSSRDHRSNEQSAPQKRADSPAQGCLHCKGQHWLNDCPTASDEQKKLALRAFMDKRRGGESSAMKRILHIEEELETKHVAFNGVVVMPYHPDNGTKYNIIPRHIVQEILEVAPTAKISQLENPIDGKAVGGAIIRCRESIQLDLELLTPAGKVRIRNVTCIITETEEDEFLLGRMTLTAMGIDVEEQLAALANKEVVDFDPFESAIPIDFDPPDKRQIFTRLCELVNEAIDNGFPVEKKRALFDVVTRYDIWRLSIGNDPPSKIEPFEIRFKEGTVPIRCKPRTYAPAERDWMKGFNESLVALGWVYRNEASRWASPARPVKKPGKSRGLRQAVDFRRPNAMIVPLAGSMPSLSTRFHHAKNKTHKQTVDFLKSFWQMALAQVSQESQSYMTEDGIFTPTRLQQGSVDSSIHFQQSVEKIMRRADLLYNHVLAWVDDLLIYADTIDEFLVVLDRVYGTLAEYGLFLGLDKICLYTTNAKWCGRVITPTGVMYDPEKIQSLVEIPEPRTAAELQQFLCASGWMRNSLVDFARVAAPLHERLQMELIGTKRTKRVAARITITLSDVERDSFAQVKQLLTNSATLVTPDDNDELILMTDASDQGWSIILTVVTNWDPSINITEQHHQLVHCMSGTFKGASQHWSVSEKEAFPIIKAATDLDYLLIDFACTLTIGT
ncbi:hypothetical protein PHMEG_00030491 [Phytophthora megakarya]|uniref:Reverse transcriptase domain-containing protein n=1 Tax=Phytophthora megakarya TaxID=4795 RepID=A0A225V0I6_9STRA|nr:hypothetical protein PHMEG_00030491 [Phytophthora megakarya]